MTDEQMKIRTEDIIIQSIQGAPEATPPLDLTQRIMAGLQAKKPSLWTRLRLWSTRPHVLTFRPLQAISAATLVIALAALVVISRNRPVEEAFRPTTVRFVLHDADMAARNVAVIGSFNHWRADRSVMWYSSEAKAWILESRLPPGDHEYLFLVNGEKLVPDPEAPMTIDDGFGNRNSILFVGGEHEQAL